MLFVYQDGQSPVSLDTPCTQLFISLPQSCLATLLTQPYHSPLPPWPSCLWGEHTHLCGTKPSNKLLHGPGGLLWGLKHFVKEQKGQRSTPDPSLGWRCPGGKGSTMCHALCVSLVSIILAPGHKQGV